MDVVTKIEEKIGLMMNSPRPGSAVFSEMVIGGIVPSTYSSTSSTSGIVCLPEICSSLTGSPEVVGGGGVKEGNCVRDGEIG